MIKKQIAADDGLALSVFYTPLQSDFSVVFLNDFGVDSRIVWRLAERAVERGVSFVTWNTRGVPGAHASDFRDYGVARHASDCLTVMNHLRLDQAVLVGWCGSCQLGLQLARRSPSRVAGVVLVSGYFGLPGALTRNAGRMMIELAESVSANEERAKFFHKALASHKTSQDAASDGSASAWCKPLTEGFKSNPEALLRWAAMQVQLVGADVDAMCTGVDCPVWFVAAGADEMIAPADVEPVAQRIAHAQLTVFPNADHYALFADESVQAAVIARARSWSGADGLPERPRFTQSSAASGA